MYSGEGKIKFLFLFLFSPAGERAHVPHPLWFGEGGGGVHTHSLAEEGVGGSQFRLGDRHCGTLGIHIQGADDKLEQFLDQGI
jgi:hypothetical protein